MQIIINSQKSNINPPLSIQGYLLQQKIDSQCLVAEINGRIIKQAEWPTTFLQENDVVELISFVGGG